MEEALSPWYKSTKPTPKPVVEKSDASILRTLKLMLQGSIYGSWNIDKPGEKDRVRREFRTQQQRIYPDHSHLIEQALEELLPGGILDELDQTSTPVVVNPTGVEEPKPALEITNTTPVSEPVPETSTAPATQPSSRDEAPAALPDVQEGLRRIQQAMTIAHSRGMTIDEVYPHVDNLMKKYGITSFKTEFIQPLLDLWKEPEAPKNDPSIKNDPQPGADTEEWISTLGFPLQERLEAILAFLDDHQGDWFTRSQIEIGAGYRRPDNYLPKEEYEPLKRRVQRDLALLEKDGDVVHTTRPNPKKNTKGQNNDIHLYCIADPDQDGSSDPDAFPAGLRRDLGAAIAAFDQRDMEALIAHLTPVSNWLARVAGVTPDASS